MTDEASSLADAQKKYGLIGSAPETVFDKIVQEASFHTGAPISTITMVDDTQQWFKAKVGVDRDGDLLSESICAVAMRADQEFVVEDVSVDSRFKNLRAVTEDGIRFYAGVPLVVRDGTRMGTLCVIDTEARGGLDEDERQALQALAKRTVAAMELRRDLSNGSVTSPTNNDWLSRAQDLLEQGAAALTQVAATVPLAHLETVIEMLKSLQARAPTPAGAT